jgi:hypothetical protein
MTSDRVRQVFVLTRFPSHHVASLDKDYITTAMTELVQSPTEMLSLAQADSLNRFPSPPPIAMPSFNFPIVEDKAGHKSPLPVTAKPSESSASSSRTSSRQNSMSGSREDTFSLGKRVKEQSRIIVPAITLSQFEHPKEGWIRRVKLTCVT